jgi:predicted metal-dependent HD superfamily phosphohydrolase
MWAHMVSDTSLEELHAFAGSAGVPPRAFDLDHYDVPADRVPALLAAGAEAVTGRELLLRLRASGLRVPGAQRDAERARRRRADLTRRWSAVAHPAVVEGAWASIAAALLTRWTEVHRSYHDDTHLTEVLERLDTLAEGGYPVTRAVVLAAWFHDAVYDGVPGQDEERSAELATATLGPYLPDAEVAEVARLVRLTATHQPDAADFAGAALCDADLAILASPPRRYAAYAAAVRAEYAHVPDADFRTGRGRVLRALLAHEHLYATPEGRRRWEQAARRNITDELTRLDTG